VNDSTNYNTNQHPSVNLPVPKTLSPPTIQGVAPKADVLGFAERIEREFCQGSAIAPSLYRANIEIIKDKGSWEPNWALGQKVSINWQTHQPHGFGAIAMLNQETGEGWQGKPQQPRTNRANGKPIKYESISGGGSRAYLPAIDTETRKAIAIRYGVAVPLDGSFWDWLYYHPTIPILITEGGKKSMAALTLGYVAIALYGINGGYRANDRIDGAVVPLAKRELIADVIRFAVAGRPVILAFDQDDQWKTRCKVAAALFTFGALLKATGAQVAIASWKASHGKGIDDLIVNRGAAAAEDAIATAISFDLWAIGRKLGRRVKRSPDLSIGDREFSEVVDSLPNDRDIAFVGGKGTGKSKAIALLLGTQGWISITSLQSLARDQAEGWGGAFINDGDRYDDKFLKDGKAVAGGTVCAPSLPKTMRIKADVVIVDETTAVLAFLLISNLCNKDGIRPLLLTEFERRIRDAKQVIIADADMTEEALAYLESIRGTKFYLVTSERKPLKWTAHIAETKAEIELELVERAKNLPDGKMIYANFDEKSAASAIAKMLEGLGIGTLLITAETSGGEIERSFLASKGGDLPALYMAGVRAIITSPSVTQGFSIEKNVETIDSVFGIYGGATITAKAVAQSCDRVRSAADRYLYIAKRGRAYSKISRAMNEKEFIREFKTASGKTARLSRLSLRPETNDAIAAIDWDSETFKMLASIEVERNQGMAAFRDSVTALLRHEGKTVTPFKSSFSKAELKAQSAFLAEIASTAKREREVAIAASPVLDDVQAAELEAKARKQPLDATELLALERYYLAKFYRLETVTSDDVRFDSTGRTRSQIKRMESDLSDADAIRRTIASIEKPVGTYSGAGTVSAPQDWDKAALRCWLLSQTGVMEFLQGVIGGSIVALTEAVVAPIAALLKAHPKEFRLAFGFSNIDTVSDMQAIGTLLDFYGVKRVCQQSRVDGVRIRLYSIDGEHLGKMNAIVQRRSEGVTPLPSIELEGGGVPARTAEEIADLRQMLATSDDPECVQSMQAIAISLGMNPNPEWWPGAIAS